MSNKQKHRWYDVIVAWASGEKIQFNDTRFEQEWSTLEKYNDPFFNDDNFEWRVKPKTVTKKYRMALFNDNNVVAYDVTNSTLDDAIEYKLKGFVGWIGDTAEIEEEI